MSDPYPVNLLIVDRSRSDTDHIVKTLRGDGYQLEPVQTDQAEEIRSAIDYQPLDLILLRITDELPAIAEIRLMVAEAQQDIPIIAVIDDDHRQAYRPSRLLEEGADNFFYLDDADHLVAAIRKELRHLRDRKRQQSFEIRFKESETRSQTLLENIQEPIAYIHEGVHTYANLAYLRLFNYERKEDLAHIQLVHMVPPGYRDALKSVLRRSIRSGKAIEPVELVGLRSDGQTFPILLECAPTRMNDEPCTQIIVRNAQEKNAYNQQLEEMLKFDEVTGLYSRRFFLEALEIDHDGVVLYILFTDYASIRHDMGFEALEEFIREAARLFKHMLAPDDMASRFASEVFVVYLPSRSSTDPLALAERIRETIAKYNFKINGKLFTTTCCIGAYDARGSHENALQVLSHADRACETARQRGNDQVEICISPKEEQSRRSKTTGAVINEEDEAVIRLLRDALTSGRLTLHYQPIVSFENAEEARYKVYLRIIDESGAPPSMDKMGSVAVRYGMMSTLDKWTIIRSMAALIEIQKRGDKPPVLFMRLSRNSLADKDFLDWLIKRFKESRLACSLLVFEIKEDDADECFEETRLLQARLRELGCGMALSHFGGKSHSERLLEELVPDYIKLDGRLIERLAKAKDNNSRQAMATLAQHAHDLKTRVVAAGVTTAPQMASIWQFGVTLVQGTMVAEADEHLDFDFRQYAG